MKEAEGDRWAGLACAAESFGQRAGSPGVNEGVTWSPGQGP